MAADLKHQFQLIQEQQKQKLLRRNMLKDEDSQKKTAFSATKNIGGGKNKSKNNSGLDLYADEVEDDLNLEVVGVNDDAFDDAEMIEMEETIRELRDENGRLYKLLGEKSEEMKILKRRWQDEKKELTGQNIGSENVAQKIIDLSKKNRDLTAEVESYRTKYRQAQNQMQKLDSELKKISSKPKEISPSEAKDLEVKNENKVAELEVKLNQLNAKVMEYRNQIETQKKELKIAHKVLTNEVGEGVNIQSLLNSTSNWRGRQQTIVNLQKKLADLQHQQQQYAASSRQGSSRLTNSSVMSSMSYQSPLAATMHDEKIRSTIKKIEMERKETQQKLQSDLEALQNEHARVKEKHDAAKTRNQVLSKELKSIKTQIATLIEKGKHDDDLVAALMREQEYLKNINEKLVKEKNESSPSNRVVKASQDTQINKELKRQIEEQESKVKQLEDEIQSLKDARNEEKSKENKISANGQLPQKPVSRPKPSMIPTPPASAERRNGYRYRRGSSANSEDVPSLRAQFQEMKLLFGAAEVERDRLFELVQVLQHRISETTENCITADNKTIELKRQNAKLEKQVEKLKSNLNIKSQISHGIHGKNRPTSRSNKNGHREKTVDELQEELDELKTRLEIQADENDALKEALNSTLKAKNDDIRIYQEMSEQTKIIFIQGMKQLKQTTTTTA